MFFNRKFEQSVLLHDKYGKLFFNPMSPMFGYEL